VLAAPDVRCYLGKGLFLQYSKIHLQPFVDIAGEKLLYGGEIMLAEQYQWQRNAISVISRTIAVVFKMEGDTDLPEAYSNVHE
jgi:hypothetical protein